MLTATEYTPCVGVTGVTVSFVFESHQQFVEWSVAMFLAKVSFTDEFFNKYLKLEYKHRNNFFMTDVRMVPTNVDKTVIAKFDYAYGDIL
jgi:hypothetical protein